jgi:energy-coupling factor transporter transmembrane protein EcfT
MRPERPHPLPPFIAAGLFVAAVFFQTLAFKAALVVLGLVVALMLPRIGDRDPGRLLLRVSIVAAVFLALIHGFYWEGGPNLERGALRGAAEAWLNIAALLVATLALVRRIRSEDIYAFLLDLRVPPSVILIVLSGLAIVPRIGRRAHDVHQAQQLRGFAIRGIRNRLRAYRVLLAPLLSTTVYELEDTAASLAARGLHFPGPKSHRTSFRISRPEVVVVAIVSIVSGLLLLLALQNAFSA